jgi:hypothetical protein
MNELNDLSTVVIGKLSKLVNKEICSHDLDRKRKKKKKLHKICNDSFLLRAKKGISYHLFCSIIIVQVRYSTIETKEVARIGYNGFLAFT